MNLLQPRRSVRLRLLQKSRIHRFRPTAPLGQTPTPSGLSIHEFAPTAPLGRTPTPSEVSSIHEFAPTAPLGPDSDSFRSFLNS